MPTQSPLANIQSVFLAGTQTLPIRIVPGNKARRYILRVKPDGWAYVTVPRGGSRREALAFAREHQRWIEKQLGKLARALEARPAWRPGCEILLRGQPTVLSLDNSGRLPTIRFGTSEIVLSGGLGEFERALRLFLWELAAQELPERVWTLAGQHRLPVRRVTVRDQRSRWGSCSVKGTISLNWRLVQTPPFVRDYIILHELMHLKEMNHSPRFWNLVAEACPDFQAAEAWLKTDGKKLIS